MTAAHGRLTLPNCIVSFLLRLMALRCRKCKGTQARCKWAFQVARMRFCVRLRRCAMIWPRLGNVWRCRKLKGARPRLWPRIGHRLLRICGGFCRLHLLPSPRAVAGGRSVDPFAASVVSADCPAARPCTAQSGLLAIWVCPAGQASGLGLRAGDGCGLLPVPIFGRGRLMRGQTPLRVCFQSAHVITDRSNARAMIRHRRGLRLR